MRVQSYPPSSREAAAAASLDSATRNRVRTAYGVIVIILMLFGLRLFYVQIIRHGYYQQAALSDQLKQYEIPSQRGLILAHDNDSTVPIVLNQTLYTLYADPAYVRDASTAAAKLAAIAHGDAAVYERQMQLSETRYVVLARRLSLDQKQRIAALKLPGIGTQPQSYRTYPQGTLAAQLLGFVDSDGLGRYGLEQAANASLSGQPGQVKAVTDVNGVPLPATRGNVQVAPTDGVALTTTIDLSMQAQMEQILHDEADKTKSKQLNAVILDTQNGQIKAMANYPSYDPANYQNVADSALFQNGTVTNAIEPGSIMKTLTTAAALDLGAVQPDSTFYDPAHWLVDNFNITDIEEDGGARQQSVSSILSLSLNTGATWLLMQMSNPGGTEITQKGVDAWRSYMTSHYRFGYYTDVEQGYESPGVVPERTQSSLTYANTSFGQGIQITPLQMAAAVAATVNGGTYYQPTLIDQTTLPNGHVVSHPPVVQSRSVVKPSTSQALQGLMENVVHVYAGKGFGYMNFPSQYIVGGKTGTAQIAKPGGGYRTDAFNGTYAGFVGGDHAQYVIVVYNTEPHVVGYAGAQAGQPVFADLVHMLINNSRVTPKQQ